jgi:hypothetical protein
MSDLLKINVNDHTEKKGQLTYLSWAWAWAEVLKVDPKATWVVHMYGPPGAEQPCMWIGETAMVHTSVTINGLTRECLLPVMDNRNNAMKNPDARKVSDAIMRCMTKAISMHGLGLYIYAGEDLPEGEDQDITKGGTVHHAVRDGIGDDLPDDDKQYLLELAAWCTKNVAKGDSAKVAQHIANEKLEADQRVYLENQMDSKTRSAIKKAEQAIREAMNVKEPA